MKSLTLVIENEEKTFTIPFVNGLVWRNYIELQDNVEDINKLTAEDLDQFVNLAVIAFKNQFTLEQFYEGISCDKVMWTIQALFVPTEKNLGNDKTGKK